MERAKHLFALQAFRGGNDEAGNDRASSYDQCFFLRVSAMPVLL